MFGRATATAAAAAALTMAFAASAGAAAPIVPSAAADVEYHAEGQIIAGNIQIQTDRAPNQGTAVADCDPDPRPAPHPRPDGCAFATPAGAGRDHVSFGRHIPDADESPNGAFGAAATATRENFNGRAGFLDVGAIFVGDFFDDDDMNFRLTPRTLDAYLAPNGDPNNRWRRFCGTGIVDQFNNLTPASPFRVGEIRKFIVEVWDADFRDPSDDDGGNQDFWVIDILKPGSLFDISSCRTAAAGPGPAPGPGPGPGPLTPPPAGNQPVLTGQAPTATTGSQPPLVAGVAPRPRLLFASAAARGPGRCVVRPFRVAVRGANILRVDFSVDGRFISRATRRDATGAFRATISPRGLSDRLHRVIARVVFRPAARSRARMLLMTFRRCPRPIARPVFTG
jgi:hypothetical protein